MQKISESTVKRLSLYLRILEEFEAKNHETLSSEDLASRTGATSAQVRKDLSLFGSFGKRGLGYPISELSKKIRQIMGLEHPSRVILVGAGKLGAALVGYHGFAEHGFNIVAAYDKDRKRIGQSLGSLKVTAEDKLEADLRRDPVDIAIITTPSGVAQEVADRLARCGVRAVLNFTNTKLMVPGEIVVKDVNMAVELESLSFAIQNQYREAI